MGIIYIFTAMKSYFFTSFNLLGTVLIFLFIVSSKQHICGQVIFNEQFNEADGLTFGNSAEGIPWNVNCADCSFGYYEVRSNVLEQNKSDGPSTFITGAIDVSTCSTLTLTMSYTGLPYPGSGSSNFESAAECSCPGNPNDALNGSCFLCWDFFLAELVFDNGVREEAEFIGVSNLPTTASINFETECIGNASQVSLELKSQTWASDEFTYVDNIMIVCNQGTGGVTIFDPNGPEHCAGETVDFQASSFGAVSYEWRDPDNNIVGSNSPDYSFLASENFGTRPVLQDYTVIAIDASGCKSTGEWNIIVDSAPTAELSSNVMDLCEGENLIITEIGGNASGWTWSGPGSGNPGSNDQWTINNVSVSDEGTYSVTVTDAGICTSADGITINISASTAYTLPDYGMICASEEIIMLETTFDGVSGNWEDAGPVLNNSFDPSLATIGMNTLTFTPDDTGCISSQTSQIEILDSPSSFPAGPLNECGATVATFDLASLNTTINGGNGLTVNWFADAEASTPIADTHTTSATTVYAFVIDAMGCTSVGQPIALQVGSGPDVFPADTAYACVEFLLPAIMGDNLSGNEAYYNEEDGMGTRYLPGEKFEKDTILYIYDASGTCSDQEDFVIRVGNPKFAGSDVTSDICATGNIDLISIKDPIANTGIFIDENGNTIPNNILNTNGLEGTSMILSYFVPPDSGCIADEAIYNLSFSPFNTAGVDTVYDFCLGTSVDLNSLTHDNGGSGSFFIEGELTPALTNFNTSAVDQEFTRTYYYVVDNVNPCESDSARIIINANSISPQEINGTYCFGFDTLINGVMFDFTHQSELIVDNSDPTCPKSIDVNLNILPENRRINNSVFCTGQSITINNNIYDENNPMGVEIIISGDLNGCDSIIEIDLGFDSEALTLINDSYCFGEQVVINDVTFNQNYTSQDFQFQGSTGCDSTVMVDLSFMAPGEGLINDVMCPGEELSIGNETFTILDPSGSVILPNSSANGCDSIVNIDLQYDLSFSSNINNQICADQEININGTSFNKNNRTGLEIIVNQGNCDSVLIIDLEVLDNDTLILNNTFCNDTSLLINNVEYNMNMPSGNEIILGASSNGCNQYIMVDLNFQENVLNTIDTMLCSSEELIVNGTSYNFLNSNGTEVLSSSQGCDSTVNINLSFSGIFANIEKVSPSCNSDDEGLLVIDILEGLDGLVDIRLDGNSILNDYLSNDTIFNVSFGNHEIEFIDIASCDFRENFDLVKNDNDGLSIESSIVEDKGYQLNISFEGEIDQIIWTPSEGLDCSDCPNPIATPPTDQIYNLEIIDINGCTYSNEIALEYIFVDVYYKPNIFSPNNDGVNDIFFIDSSEDVQFSNFEIFDRWGNLVFRYFNGTTGNDGDGWDGNTNGNLNDSGVYVYKITLELPNGPQTLIGDLTLIR